LGIGGGGLPAPEIDGMLLFCFMNGLFFKLPPLPLVGVVGNFVVGVDVKEGRGLPLLGSDMVGFVEAELLLGGIVGFVEEPKVGVTTELVFCD